MSNSDNSDNMSSLEDLFKAEIKKPFHYKLSLTDINNNNHDIFESMRKIFMTGLVIHYGNEETKVNSYNPKLERPKKLINRLSQIEINRHRVFIKNIGCEKAWNKIKTF